MVPINKQLAGLVDFLMGFATDGRAVFSDLEVDLSPNDKLESLLAKSKTPFTGLIILEGIENISWFFNIVDNVLVPIKDKPDYEVDLTQLKGSKQELLMGNTVTEIITSIENYLITAKPTKALEPSDDTKKATKTYKSVAEINNIVDGYINSKDVNKNDASYILPTATSDSVKQSTLNARNLREAGGKLSTVTGVWVNNVLKGDEATVKEGYFSGGMLNTDYKQSLLGDTPDVRVRSLNIESGKVTKLSGESSLAFLKQLTGTGRKVTLPLYGTGVFVTIKPASDADILEIQALIAQDMLELGRQTYGLMLSSNNSAILKRAVDLVKRNIVHVSVNTDAELGNPLDYAHLKTIDMYTLIMGYLAARYADGFKYNRTCMDDPDKCKKIEEGLVNIHRMIIHKEHMLSEEQLTFMRESMHEKKSMAEMLAYQEMATKDKRVSDIPITETATLKMFLEVPSAQTHFKEADAWFDEIIKKINGALDEDTNDPTRNRYLDLAKQATVLRKWSSSVKRFEIHDGEGGMVVVDQKQDILAYLDDLSTDPVVVKKIANEMKSFVEFSNITLCTIPTYVCKTCNSEQSPSYLIPIDPLSVFMQTVAGITQTLIRKNQGH